MDTLSALSSDTGCEFEPSRSKDSDVLDMLGIPVFALIIGFIFGRDDDALKVVGGSAALSTWMVFPRPRSISSIEANSGKSDDVVGPNTRLDLDEAAT